MDEMEKSIRTRSEALGYKFAVLLLATWTLVNLVLYLATGGARDMLPTLVLIAVLLAAPAVAAVTPGITWISTSGRSRQTWKISPAMP